nr:hypothetical protein CDS [Bradyrhizobium sp.]
MPGLQHPVTPDGRYFVVRGRLWRMSDPDLAVQDKERRAADGCAASREGGQGD